MRKNRNIFQLSPENNAEKYSSTLPDFARQKRLVKEKDFWIKKRANSIFLFKNLKKTPTKKPGSQIMYFLFLKVWSFISPLSAHRQDPHFYRCRGGLWRNMTFRGRGLLRLRPGFLRGRRGGRSGRRGNSGLLCARRLR